MGKHLAKSNVALKACNCKLHSLWQDVEQFCSQISVFPETEPESKMEAQCGCKTYDEIATAAF